MRRRKETEHEILTGTIEGWEKEVWLYVPASLLEQCLLTSNCMCCITSESEFYWVDKLVSRSHQLFTKSIRFLGSSCIWMPVQTIWSERSGDSRLLFILLDGNRTGCISIRFWMNPVSGGCFHGVHIFWSGKICLVVSTTFILVQ